VGVRSDLRPQRILVTGAAGFIASHLVEYLRSLPGYEVIGVDVGTVDLAAPDAGAALPRNIDHCYHFAGTMPTWRFYEHPHQLLANDIRATLNLVEWAAAGHCRKILFASSNEVYARTGVDEDAELCLGSILQPRTSYQLAKITNEAILFNWAAKTGFAVTAFRLSNVYGPRMHDDQVIARFVQLAHGRTDPFPVTEFDASRQFVHVADVVRTMHALRHTSAQIVNIPGEEVRLLDLARLVCRIAGYAPQFVETVARPGSPKVKRMFSKYELPARSLSLEEGLRGLYAGAYLTA
jgi:nucleoside-diphosphate-sugar epimerase